MDKPTCETCRFWLAEPTLDQNEVKIGGCHRFPPVESNGQAGWPGVFLFEWCGEHQPAKAEPLGYWKEFRIEDMDLSSRARKSCSLLDCHTAGDINAKLNGEFLALKCCGELTLLEIRRAVAEVREGKQ